MPTPHPPARAGVNRLAREKSPYLLQHQHNPVDWHAWNAEAFAAARAGNTRPPEAHHRKRVEENLMRTEDGRWTWRYDRALRSPTTLRPRDPETAWRSLANIAAPTLIIRGALSDVLSPEVAARMLEVIPDVRLTEVANSGHSVPLDAPEGFAAAARAFLKGPVTLPA